MSYKDFKTLLEDLASRKNKLDLELTRVNSKISELKDKYAIAVADGKAGESYLVEIDKLTKQQSNISTQISILAGQDHRGAVARSAREGNSELGRLAVKVRAEAQEEINKLQASFEDKAKELEKVVGRYDAIINEIEDLEHQSILMENRIKEALPYLPDFPSHGKAHVRPGVRLRRLNLPAPHALAGQYVSRRSS